MIINILAGGPIDLLPSLEKYDKENIVWVGVDRGVFTLIQKGIIPQYAFGDFDSVSSEELAVIREQVGDLQKFSPEKDETDMELAINWALQQEPTLIQLFGATGGRLDHLFANVQLLLKPILQNINTEMEIIDNKNTIYIRSAGEHSIQKMNDRKYISFVPVSGAISRLTLVGFKYPLKDCHIPLGSTLCISNELINDYGTFSFTEGILMVIRSRD
ncbi:thiamine diphosphokinase [Bacillus sp. 31A1R]|uniref:Thiamine diphosphokinase n=1 Tax=Robertmurraya mangrovi TaxID=3098077 RepID=A0ABU5J4V2_9BACI|nr:thiamine diphosphokinase [Bacillus sp. 31A1R]MDZ5474385.1 thiamine diphosphokinase [Bacillus sp. 31A1R]